MGLSVGLGWSYSGISEGRFSKVASMQTVDPIVRDFILFCLQRQGKGWPALYDEMCWVAGRRLFRGLGYTDLRKLGLSFSLANIDDTIRMVDTVAASN
ncbi:hypothetical protein ES703_27305 [subsurface metagenome]